MFPSSSSSSLARTRARPRTRISATTTRRRSEVAAADTTTLLRGGKLGLGFSFDRFRAQPPSNDGANNGIKNPTQNTNLQYHAATLLKYGFFHVDAINGSDGSDDKNDETHNPILQTQTPSSSDNDEPKTIKELKLSTFMKYLPVLDEKIRKTNLWNSANDGNKDIVEKFQSNTIYDEVKNYLTDESTNSHDFAFYRVLDYIQNTGGIRDAEVKAISVWKEYNGSVKTNFTTLNDLFHHDFTQQDFKHLITSGDRIYSAPNPYRQIQLIMEPLFDKSIFAFASFTDGLKGILSRGLWFNQKQHVNYYDAWIVDGGNNNNMHQYTREVVEKIYPLQYYLKEALLVNLICAPIIMLCVMIKDGSAKQCKQRRVDQFFKFIMDTLEKIVLHDQMTKKFSVKFDGLLRYISSLRVKSIAQPTATNKDDLDIQEQSPGWRELINELVSKLKLGPQHAYVLELFLRLKGILNKKMLEDLIQKMKIRPEIKQKFFRDLKWLLKICNIATKLYGFDMYKMRLEEFMKKLLESYGNNNDRLRKFLTAWFQYKPKPIQVPSVQPPATATTSYDDTNINFYHLEYDFFKLHPVISKYDSLSLMIMGAFTIDPSYFCSCMRGIDGIQNSKLISFIHNKTMSANFQALGLSRMKNKIFQNLHIINIALFLRNQKYVPTITANKMNFNIRSPALIALHNCVKKEKLKEVLTNIEQTDNTDNLDINSDEFYEQGVNNANENFVDLLDRIFSGDT